MLPTKLKLKRMFGKNKLYVLVIVYQKPNNYFTFCFYHFTVSSGCIFYLFFVFYQGVSKVREKLCRIFERKILVNELQKWHCLHCFISCIICLQDFRFAVIKQSPDIDKTCRPRQMIKMEKLWPSHFCQAQRSWLALISVYYRPTS